MDYELVDLIDIKELKKLTDNWTKLINLPMGIFDPHGNAFWVQVGYRSVLKIITLTEKESEDEN